MNSPYNQSTQYLEEISLIIQQQEQLLNKLNQTIQESKNQSLPLIETVGKLLEHGLNKEEIMDITSISATQYVNIVSKYRSFQLPFIYLNEAEAKEFHMLLLDIHKANDINDLINSEKESKRIQFVHNVLVRYQHEVNEINNKSDDRIDIMMSYIERETKTLQTERVYSSLVRIFGNEIKRKREEVLIRKD